MTHFGRQPVLRAKDIERRADECKRMARTSMSDREKQSWLELAAAWLRMTPAPEPSLPSAEDAFDAEVCARETNQTRFSAKN
jgi:hypothetical protein